MEEIKIKEHTFRIKKMNMIETLAIRSTVNFDSIEHTTSFYYDVLERIQLKVSEDKWVPVKEKGRDVFYPAGIEDDFETIEKLITYFMKWLKSVFMKSDVSKD